MPIAIPTYVSAYIYAGLFEPSGMIFDSVENYLGLGKELYDLIELRNIYGVIFILSICLYPYVYLLSYSSFKEQSYCALEVGKSLGLSDKELFEQPDGSHLGECPLCVLPLSLDLKKSTLYSCCCKLAIRNDNVATK